MTYNPDYIDYINENFNNMKVEDTSKEKTIIHELQTYFSVLSSKYGEPHNFQEAWHHKDPEESEG